MSLEVLETLTLGQHSVVQDAADEDAFLIYSIDDNVLFPLDAPVPGSDLIARAAHLRGLNE